MQITTHGGTTDASDKSQAQVPFAASASYAAKPPLGLIPRKLCVEKRLHEIIEAIGRYQQGQYIIPVEWFEEAAEICRWLERHNGPDQGRRANDPQKP